MALRILTLMQIAALLCAAACHDKPTKPKVYHGDPQQVEGLSADSHYVYFYDEGNGTGRVEGIYRAPLSVGEVESVLVRNPAEGRVIAPRISPSGKRLAYAHLYRVMAVLDLETKLEFEILPADVVRIDWCNEDTIVCCLYSGELLAVEVATGATRKLWDLRVPTHVASAKGRIVFVKHLPNEGYPESSVIYTISTDGDTIGPLYTFPDEIAYRPDWNDDGTLIVVVRDYWSGDPWLATLSWPDAVLSDSLAVHAVDPAFAPDGRIVYVRLGDKSIRENDQIWIMDADGSNKERVL